MKNESLDAIKEELSFFNIPYRVEMGGKHLKVLFEVNGKPTTYTCAATPSDKMRGPKNCTADIRRMLREAGITTPIIPPAVLKKTAEEKPFSNIFKMPGFSNGTSDDLKVVGAAVVERLAGIETAILALTRAIEGGPRDATPAPCQMAEAMRAHFGPPAPLPVEPIAPAPIIKVVSPKPTRTWTRKDPSKPHRAKGEVRQMMLSALDQDRGSTADDISVLTGLDKHRVYVELARMRPLGLATTIRKGYWVKIEKGKH
jgi:hypothetical protein